MKRFARIKVVGIGGGGSNAVNSMIDSGGIQGVDFIAVNTDAQSLAQNKATTRIQIGKEITKGLGSGGDPEIGKKSAEESSDDIKKELEGSDMVFITAGLGGGTGTGACPVVASIAKSVGALTIGVVTKPFDFEGVKRSQNCDRGYKELKEKVDALITIPNQKVLDVVDKKTSLLEAFRLVDDVLGQGVRGISDLIVLPGFVNVDFADVKTIMTSAGSALMGIGEGSGEDRAEIAARSAISSPLLEIDISGATGILFNVVGGSDLTMHEIDAAAKIISEAANPDANIIFGAAIDESLNDNIRITVVATGFDMELQEAFKSLHEYQSKERSEEGKKDKKEDSDGGESEDEFRNKKEEKDLLGDDDTKYDIPTFLRRRK